ncbi:hypothetical protein MMSR116_23800 [Methylobacterium mesophilicum SR1.6/6]|uniref:Uncharacterized protein n=1 Tax=Methylobacterium mesophilicum SR1.6/6 TaxID=908290 RepID=A0A6B9FUG4_9HYPH|nr:hypothetical protein MMSR116_23800 [Methylobacterium mesophilicum SR1.6/6]
MWGDPTQIPHPEVPASAGREGGLQGSRGWLEGSFAACAERRHLRMRSRVGEPVQGFPALCTVRVAIRHGSEPVV